MCSASPTEVFDKAEEIAGMKEAYDYLCSNEISTAELDCVMRSANPIAKVYDTYEAYQMNGQESSIPLAVYEIWASQAHRSKQQER